MNIEILIPILAVFILAKFLRVPSLVWFALWWLGLLVFFSQGVNPPMPSSVVDMYMLVVTISLLLYFSVQNEQIYALFGPIDRLITDKKFQIPLFFLVIAIPCAVAFNVYKKSQVRVAPPMSGRTIHPAPPGEITFKGKKIDLLTVRNPYRELEETDKLAFKDHVEDGRVVYYQNCVFCHGDTMAGNGIFAHGFDPIPANFQDSGTIAQLQEGFLFWRIAKGGPGLPDASTPWNSAMPAFENFLSEDDIWNVILFLYDFTGQRPRAEEDVSGH